MKTYKAVILSILLWSALAMICWLINKYPNEVLIAFVILLVVVFGFVCFWATVKMFKGELREWLE